MFFLVLFSKLQAGMMVITHFSRLLSAKVRLVYARKMELSVLPSFEKGGIYNYFSLKPVL